MSDYILMHFDPLSISYSLQLKIEKPYPQSSLYTFLQKELTNSCQSKSGVRIRDFDMHNLAIVVWFKAWAYFPHVKRG